MSGRRLICIPALACIALTSSPIIRGADSALIVQARGLIGEQSYDKAVPILEEALSENKNDATAAELLGMADLYSTGNLDSRRNAEKAESAFVQALELGGSASLLMSLAKDKVKGPNVLTAEPGVLTIFRDRVEFVPTRNPSEDRLSIGSEALKECGHSRSYGKSSNTLYLKTSKGEFFFRPHHFSAEEGTLVCKLVAKYFGAKSIP